MGGVPLPIAVVLRVVVVGEVLLPVQPFRSLRLRSAASKCQSAPRVPSSKYSLRRVAPLSNANLRPAAPIPNANLRPAALLSNANLRPAAPLSSAVCAPLPPFQMPVGNLDCHSP